MRDKYEMNTNFVFKEPNVCSLREDVFGSKVSFLRVVVKIRRLRQVICQHYPEI